MAARKDGRKIFSLSSLLVTIALAGFCGYLAFVGGFWSSTGDFFITFYGFIALICGGFALSAGLHLIMVPKASPQNNQENGSNAVSQQARPSPTKETKPGNKSIVQNKPAPKPATKIPAAQSLPAKPPAQAPHAPSTEPQAVKLVGPVAKNNMQFLETFIKLAKIAKDCEELVENEKDLSKKEQVRLSLQRREFRQIYSTVKNSRFESF